MPRCESQAEAGLDTPAKVQVYLGMLSKWREGARGVNLHGDFNFSWKENICAPLGDGGGVFI